jgi:hypothetical protein
MLMEDVLEAKMVWTEVAWSKCSHMQKQSKSASGMTYMRRGDCQILYLDCMAAASGSNVQSRHPLLH